MNMNRKGAKKATSLWTILIVAALAVGIWYGYSQGWFAQLSLPSGGGTQGGTPPGDEFCANNPQVDLQVGYIDKSVTTSTTYLNTSVYLVDKSVTPALVSEYGLAGTSGRSTLSNVLICGHSYELYFKSLQNSTNGQLTPIQISAAQTRADPVIIDTQGTANVGKLTARVFDLVNNGFINATIPTVNATNAAIELNKSYIVNFTKLDDTGVVGAGTTVGTDGYFHYQLIVRTSTADKVYGENTLIAVDLANDANANDWNPDSLVLKVDGVALQDVTNSISNNDRAALVGYEKVFKMVSPIGDQDTYIDFYLQAGSGENPNYDVTVWFVPTGSYRSTSDISKILTDVAFQDNGATRTGISGSETLSMTLQID